VLHLAETYDQRAVRHHWRTQQEQQPKHSLPQQDWIEQPLHDRQPINAESEWRVAGCGQFDDDDRLLVY
jgi:hypothetical protein